MSATLPTWPVLMLRIMRATLTTQRAQDPLNKEYTLNYRGLNIKI